MGKDKGEKGEGKKKKEKKENRSVKTFVGSFSFGSKKGDSELEDRARASQQAIRLRELQANLEPYGVPCPQLATALKAHDEALDAATSESDQAQRTVKYDLLIKANEKAIKEAEGWLVDAAAHQKNYTVLSNLLAELYGAALNDAARPSAGERAQQLIIALQGKMVDAKTMKDASYFPYKARDLERLAKEAATVDVSVDDKKRLQVNKASTLILAARDLVATLPADLQAGAIAAMDKIDEDLDLAVLGLSSDKAPLTVRVGTEDIAMNPTELIRAVSDVAKDFKKTLSDPGSDDRKLMELEGPERFVAGLTKLQRHLKAFGGSKQGLTAAQAMAIHRYTGDDYSAMNLVSRGAGKQDDAKLKLLCELVEQALPQLPVYPSEAWPVHRAERAWSQDVIDKRYAPNSEFATGVFWSTGARGALDLGGATPIFMHSIYGQNGRDVAALSANPGEGAEGGGGRENNMRGLGEVLFSAKTRFKVVGREVKPAVPKEGIKYDPEGNGEHVINTKLIEL